MKTIKEACQKLKAHSCSSFEYTDDGFKAHYDNNGKENLMFFSVPYSDGFTAYVNGEEADVEKVNYGFMAVKIPANTSCDIVFSLQNTGTVRRCGYQLNFTCRLLHLYSRRQRF